MQKKNEQTRKTMKRNCKNEFCLTAIRESIFQRADSLTEKDYLEFFYFAYGWLSRDVREMSLFDFFLKMKNKQIN